MCGVVICGEFLFEGFDVWVEYVIIVCDDLFCDGV